MASLIPNFFLRASLTFPFLFHHIWYSSILVLISLHIWKAHHLKTACNIQTRPPFDLCLHLDGLVEARNATQCHWTDTLLVAAPHQPPTAWLAWCPTSAWLGHKRPILDVTDMKEVEPWRRIEWNAQHLPPSVVSTASAIFIKKKLGRRRKC